MIKLNGATKQPTLTLFTFGCCFHSCLRESRCFRRCFRSCFRSSLRFRLGFGLRLRQSSSTILVLNERASHIQKQKKTLWIRNVLNTLQRLEKKAPKNWELTMISSRQSTHKLVALRSCHLNMNKRTPTRRDARTTSKNPQASLTRTQCNSQLTSFQK